MDAVHPKQQKPHRKTDTTRERNERGVVTQTSRCVGEGIANTCSSGAITKERRRGGRGEEGECRIQAWSATLASCHKLRLNQPVYLIVHNDYVLQMNVEVQADRHQTQILQLYSTTLCPPYCLRSRCVCVRRVNQTNNVGEATKKVVGVMASAVTASAAATYGSSNGAATAEQVEQVCRKVRKHNMRGVTLHADHLTVRSVTPSGSFCSPLMN